MRTTDGKTWSRVFRYVTIDPLSRHQCTLDMNAPVFPLMQCAASPGAAYSAIALRTLAYNGCCDSQGDSAVAANVFPEAGVPMRVIEGRRTQVLVITRLYGLSSSFPRKHLKPGHSPYRFIGAQKPRQHFTQIPFTAFLSSSSPSHHHHLPGPVAPSAQKQHPRPAQQPAASQGRRRRRPHPPGRSPARARRAGRPSSCPGTPGAARGATPRRPWSSCTSGTRPTGGRRS